jgi:3-oxoadipate enol-lactonase
MGHIANRLSRLPNAERHARRMALWDTRCDEQWRQHHPDQVDEWFEEWSAFERDTAAVPGHPGGSHGQLAARRTHDTFDRLPEIGAATLVLGGVWDGIAPFDRQLALARRIPGATIAMFDGGHRVLWQAPRAPALVVDFLAR